MNAGLGLGAKRLELLQELVPKLHRVMTFYNPDRSPAQASARMAREAGARLGVQLIERHVRSVAEVRAALARALARDVVDRRAALLVRRGERGVRANAAIGVHVCLAAPVGM